MEYAGGQSLETHIKRKQPVALDLVKSYTEEILQALEYIHSKDVVHKNLRVSEELKETFQYFLRDTDLKWKNYEKYLKVFL